MDQNTLPTPSIDTTQPHLGDTPAVNPSDPVVATDATAPKKPSSSAAMPVAKTPPAIPELPQAGVPPTTASTADTPTDLVSGYNLPAEDNDLIEKEWVEKAKTIVEQTKYDPYAQNKEITSMKAAYLKKRYNKDIKVSDE